MIILIDFLDYYRLRLKSEAYWKDSSVITLFGRDFLELEDLLFSDNLNKNYTKIIKKVTRMQSKAINKWLG